MNISTLETASDSVSSLLDSLASPVRVQILFILGAGETCVCHLVAALGLRQAGISQHLMALRKIGLVTARRAGRNMYYRLACPEILDLLRQAARIAGPGPAGLDALTHQPAPGCPCPMCSAAAGREPGC